MIVYLDTSAFVPLLVREPSSDCCRYLWDSSDTVTVTRLLFVEASAAIHRAEAIGRLDAHDVASALELLDDYWQDCDVLVLDDLLMHEAARQAGRFRLRGFDAVHCAAALLALDGEPEGVAASGDRRLLDAWRAAGLATFDPNH